MNRRRFLAGSAAAVSLAASSTTAVASSAVVVDDAAPAHELLEMRVGSRLVRPLYSRWNHEAVPLILGIRALRQQLATEDFALPLVRIRDFKKLEPRSWQILIDGEIVAEGSLSDAELTDPLNHRPLIDCLAEAARLNEDYLNERRSEAT